ncbi:hypothetical protein QTP70_008191 [Hemibagrus guttatus]|uniref:Anaphase-promoting complex subunit 4-like WD40 domain-containing protein n=1 Tax=Hemibagrus guttatus TaxID=175788 RepID=A0AAE0QXT8_9TELE|nr:hypothetical protein QTP70_008191 [Hemibagrus guttatus]
MEEVTRLVSSGDCLKIWDSTSMSVVEQFNPHSASHPLAQKKQTRVALNSTSQFLVSGGLDNTVNIWDLKTKRLHRSLKDHKEEVTCVSFNGGDSYIASGSTSGDIILHSITTNLSSKAFGHGPNEPVHDLKYSLIKRSLLGSVSDSGSVVLWDTNTQKELHMFEGAHKAPASGLAFSPANDLLFITVGLDKKIVCYDTSSKVIFRSKQVESPLTAVDFTPDGAGLVVGSTQGRIYMYDLRNLSAPIKTTTAHKTSVTCIRFQHSNTRLKGVEGVLRCHPEMPKARPITKVTDSVMPQVVRKVEKNNYPRQNVLATPPASQTTHIQSVPSFNTPEPSQRREVPTQLTYDSPASSSQPVAESAAAASASNAVSSGAPLTSVQMNFVRNMIHEALEDFRDTCHRDIINLQVEMVRQFYIQLNEIHGLIERYSVNESLVEEIEKLREENKRLRANY